MHFFKKISESKSFDLHKGVKVKVLTTSNDESMTAIQLEIEPGSLMPTHKHFEEQFGFIKEGKLTGWDDPRLGTIMALRRKGIQKETIIEFIKEVGINRSDSKIALENLYALNKKFIDDKNCFKPGFNIKLAKMNISRIDSSQN